MALFLLGAVNHITNTWNTIMMTLCWGVYRFITVMYKVFEKIAGVNIFSEEVFDEITSRIYVVLGIAMLFILAYNLIMMIVNPDQKKGSTNKVAEIVKNTVISLALLILLPVIFNYMYVFQAHVLESNILGTIILGDIGSTQNMSNCDSDDFECKCEFEDVEELKKYKNSVNFAWKFIEIPINFNTLMNERQILTHACNYYKKLISPAQRGAYSVAPTVFSAFYSPTNFTYTDCYNYLKGQDTIIETKEDKQICINYFYDFNISKYTGSIFNLLGDQYLKNEASDLLGKNGMDFNGFMALVAGIAAVTMFFIYSWQIGIRVAKLGFLQIVAPIPVMLKIVPDKGNKAFESWLKQLLGSYFEVFARLAIIYFVLFGISLVPDVVETLFYSSISLNSTSIVQDFLIILPLVKTFIILGFLKFAMDAPKLFKELFGPLFSGGVMDLALKSPKKMLEENKPAMGAMGAAAGMVNGIKSAKAKGLKGFDAVRNVAGNIRRGAVNGYESNDLQALQRGVKRAKYDTDDELENAQKYRSKAREAGWEGPFPEAVGRFKKAVDEYRDFITESESGLGNKSRADEALNSVKEKIAEICTNNSVKGVDEVLAEKNKIIGLGKESVTIQGVVYNKRPGENDMWDGSNGSEFTRHDLEKEAKKEADEDKFYKMAKAFEDKIDIYAQATKNNFNSITKAIASYSENFESSLATKINEITGGNVRNMEQIQQLYSQLIEQNTQEAREKLVRLDDVLKKALENEDKRIKQEFKEKKAEEKK